MVDLRGGVSWEWRQWELVGLQREGETLVLDIIELASDPARGSDALLSVFLAPSEPDAGKVADLNDILARWVESDAVCNVLHQESDPCGALALFQESQLLLFATPDG